ncbi:hypothetical protein GIB67_017989 [Kingdonia uniflora]|uniref:Protein kinase domain-containing protein n=1 Tax=Kingdonia uniflora TaxID=39325 RepID=A0A7J7NW78_9MAGN|nr:hypothetical protein GIB67_017989 [Kingdonia uniflora]
MQFQLFLVGATLLLSLPQLCICSECSESFKCGDDAYSYPFWGGSRPAYCGVTGFELNCRDSYTTEIEIRNSIGFGATFIVLNITEAYQIMTIVRSDLWYLGLGYCPSAFIESYSSGSEYYNRLEKVPGTLKYTLFYGCPFNVSAESGGAVCQINGTAINLYLKANSGSTKQNHKTSECQGGILILVRPSSVNLSTVDILMKGYDAKYAGSYHSDCVSCINSGGSCGSNISSGIFRCYCRDGTSQRTCPPPGNSTNSGSGIALVIGPISGSILLIILACLCWRRKYSSVNPIVFLKISKKFEKVEEFLRNNGSMAPKRYTYSDIRRMTNSFKEKLGQGGFGSVFKGKLLDGRLVAVKVMRESKSDGEDFINEVASISRTSHVNVVSLLGFCFDGSKRALIYEFMSNGSLEKFIYKNKPLETSSSLPWEKLYEIVVGVSRGLGYLHRGCNTRIVHFDIKPHNILLNENFCPKISDFGLAKLCFTQESYLSMSDARGTVGYIAPEVFSRNIGVVSHKSDVYSFGMMVFEIVGGKKNINNLADRTSEIFFPHWIHTRIELNKDLGLHGITSEADVEITKKMIIVGLWCIQTNPLDRPPMSKVVDMLEGSLESLQIPPKAFLLSSSGSQHDSSSTEVWQSITHF